jgi:hypothetical protein
MTNIDLEQLIQAADLLQLVNLCSQGNLEKLGQQPLVQLSVVNVIRAEERLPHSTMGYGKALQILLENVIAELASQEGESHEQVYRLLKLRMVGHSQKSICRELQLSESGLYRLQRDYVLPALRSRIWQHENSVHSQYGLHHTLRNVPPRSYSRLFGVESKLEQLIHLLQDKTEAGFICLHGLGGLGKTSLATAACYELAQANRIEDVIWFTAGQRRSTWGSAGACGLKDLALCTLIEQIAEQAGLADLNDLPVSERLKSLHAALAQRCTILVVDNLETAVDLDPLFSKLSHGAGPSKILVTSRHRLTGETPISAMTIDELNWQDALALLRYEAKLKGLCEVSRAAEDLLYTIYAVTGGNPQALKLVIGQCSSQPLSRVLLELETAQGRADEFYSDIYLRSWSRLSSDARRLLLSMSLLPSSGSGWSELQLASGLSDCSRLAVAVEELVEASLLLAAGLLEKQYTIHRLTYHFIQSQLLNLKGEAISDKSH